MSKRQVSGIIVIISLSVSLLLPAALVTGCRDDDEATKVVSTIPKALEAIESAAEDSFDEALAGRVEVVRASATKLNEMWTKFRPTAKQAGTKESALEAMDAAIAELRAAPGSSQDVGKLARAVNAVSAPMDTLFGQYTAPIPPAVLRLDYLGREVVLDARGGDFVGAGRHIDAIASAFASLRSKLIKADGDKAAKAYERNIASLRADAAEKRGDRLEASAKVGLELVDDIEHAFDASNDEAELPD